MFTRSRNFIPCSTPVLSIAITKYRYQTLSLNHQIAQILRKGRTLETFSYTRTGLEPGGVLPCMGHIGMCRCEGYGFQALYSSIGYISQSDGSRIGYHFSRNWPVG